jgi:hypothetical protein
MVSQPLLAQCARCDSFFKAEGIHIVTAEEIAKNPRQYRNLPTIECPYEYSCHEETSGAVGEGIKFRGKWGYLTLRYGVNYGQLKMSGRFVDNFKFDRPRQQYFSIGFDLDAPEWSGVVIRAEVDFRPQEFNGIEAETGKILRQWQIKSNNTSEEISVLYKSTRGLIRWFLGAGLGGHQLRLKQNTWIDYTYEVPRRIENPIEIRETNAFTSLSAGIMYRNRIELRFKRLGTQWSPSTVQNKMNNKSNIITVGYRI